ncbi:probable RNA-dependent RNA polymerase 1 [Trichonephila clavipes]|nr:probable RNA-dependent RNA polymerase 1 [Trichonephila clavipes]
MVVTDFLLTSRTEEVADFLVNYIKNDTIGSIAIAHLAFADQFSVHDDLCLHIAQKHAIAVDFAKTGVSERLQRRENPTQFPDFMEKFWKVKYKSKKTLGKMYRVSRDFDTDNQSYILQYNNVEEDFGNRNMPGKRARRNFSQLSEFERGLIIGMKTAGWLTRRVAVQVDRSECAVRNCWEQWTQEGTHARKTGSGANTRREDRRIVRQALVDSTVTRSTMRADVGVAIVPQTVSRHHAEANLKSKRPFRVLPLTPYYRQLRLQLC